MLFEIRNYHFKPSHFEEYKTWARDKALPFLDRELDLVGFWANTGDNNEVDGVQMDELGSANITWIIRWPDRQTRDDQMASVFSGPEWNAIFKDVPGGIDSYLRRESKFTKSLL